MEFKTHNDLEINYEGTFFIEYLDCSYDILEKIFGKPEENLNSKVDAQWTILFKDGTVATIYTWKNYSDKDIKNIKIWHIGGLNRKSYYSIMEVLS